MFGHSVEPMSVVYLDYEMTEDDLLERLAEMGYGAEADMSHLHYALLPSIGPFDTEKGGNTIVARAAMVDAQLVVIDTFARAIAGKENDADTLSEWDRWTGRRLKAAGRSFMRIDHAGKDPERGQRGTSAKNDDVDVVYELTALENDRYRLTTRKRRASWISERLEIEQTEIDGILGYRLISGAPGYPQGTTEVVADLDRLDVPVEWGQPKASKALRDAGLGKRNQTVLAAQKYRRKRLENLTPEAGVRLPAKNLTPENGVNEETPAKPNPGQVGLGTRTVSGVTGLTPEGGQAGDPPTPKPASEDEKPTSEDQNENPW